MKKWVGKIAIVTGASAGIGMFVAEKLLDEGVQVVGIARRLHLMEEHKNRWHNKKGTFYPIKCDICIEQEILNAFEWIEENLGPISILINNAGIIGNTNLMEGNTKIWKKIFDTNVLGLCICTREAVKDMIKNKIDGHIIHINSIAGSMIPFHPQSNVYPASKHAVTALSETLRKEFNSIKSRIKITDISPGLVQTQIADVLEKDSFLANVIADPKVLQPCDIADAVIYILSTPPNVQVQKLIIKPVNEIW